MDPFSGGGAGRRDSTRRTSGLTRRMKLLLAALAAGVLAVALFALSAGSDPGERAGDRAVSDSARTPSGVDEPGGPSATTGGDDSERESDSPGSGDGGQNPNGNREEGAGDSSDDAEADTGSPGGGSADSGPIPERAQDPDVAPDSGEEIQSSHEGEEQAYVQAPEGGATDDQWRNNQPQGGYDPLGRNADPGGLAGPEKERVRFAAANYVTYAYGYTGNDLSEYHSALFNTMLEGRFQNSPGRADIDAVENDIRDGGAKSAAVLDRFEVKQADGEKVQGVAYFTLGEGYDGGEVSGKSASLAQPLNLERMSGGWQVVAADRLEEVSGG